MDDVISGDWDDIVGMIVQVETVFGRGAFDVL
jgi:hypothetical protein